MLIVKKVMIDGAEYEVTISDNSKALQAAYAAGGAVIGIWDQGVQGEDFSSCLYFVTDPNDVDKEMLEQAVRRRFGMPWRIAETKRLIIREFDKNDPIETAEKMEHAGTDLEVFGSREKLNAYIDGQYRFYECGLWAILNKNTARLMGKAGITDGKLGYHIYPPFRRQGYAYEACVAILDYGKTHLCLEEVCLETVRENQASVFLAARLGFQLSKEENGLLLYVKKL